MRIGTIGNPVREEDGIRAILLERLIGYGKVED